MFSPIILGIIFYAMGQKYWPVGFISVATIPLGIFAIKALFTKPRTNDTKNEDVGFFKKDTIVLLKEDVMSHDKTTRIKAGTQGVVVSEGSYMISVEFKIDGKRIKVIENTNKFSKSVIIKDPRTSLVEGNCVVLNKDTVVSDTDKRILKSGTQGRIIMKAGSTYYVEVELDGEKIKTKQPISSLLQK